MAVSSGVTTTGPSTIPKSDRFTSGCSAGSCHSTIAVVPPISPPAPITTAIRARAERRVPATGTFGPTTAVALAKRNEPSVVEEPHRRRVLHGHEQGDVGERVLRMHARAAADEEERLQRLRGEVEHPVVLDAADPPAVERVVVRVEHAEAHRAYSTWSGRSAADDGL